MNLSDLPARELARLDAVCLEFEAHLREGPTEHPTSSTSSHTDDTSTYLESLVQRHGGEHADLLRAELLAIHEEVVNEGAASNVSEPGSAVLPGSKRDSPQDQFGEPLSEDSTRDANATKDAVADQIPEPGTRIGPYLLTSILGRGGMGVVFRATDTRLDRSVAIKLLSFDGKPLQQLVERFQREAKAVAALSHPNIVELFDVGVHQGMPYAVMEHLRGETLKRRMDPRRIEIEPITTQTVRSWGEQLADALAASHAGGVIHRDLKPENVMLLGRRSGSSIRQPAQSGPGSQADATSLKLFDFGLSRIGESGWQPEATAGQQADLAGNDTTSGMSSGDSKTRAGMILGTPGYMAPEQARGEIVTPSADVFALGCLLFEAFYGREAFEGDTPTGRYAAVLQNEPVPDPGRRRDDIVLADLILSMLAKDPAARPSAQDVAVVLSGESATVSRQGKRHRASSTSDGVVISRRRLAELAGGGVLGAVLGATLLKGSSAAELAAVRSIGVLSLTPSRKRPNGGNPPLTPEPLGDRGASRGELLAGLLVNELSRLDGISVPKYAPLTANSPEDYRAAADLLEVDALVTGTYTSSTGTAGTMDVNLQIISGKTGMQMDGIVIRTAAGDNLIEQAALAKQVAQLIGKQLTEGQDIQGVLDKEAFTCLVKGRTYSDPDTRAGLKMALECFEHAKSVDENYAQAHAGIALTSITLAARESDEKARDLIRQSREAAETALKLSEGKSSEALLAKAMLDYQTLGDFDSAKQTLSQLAGELPNHWQVHHQLGWLQTIRLDDAEGIRSLRRAVALHPTSGLVNADLARAQWFRGNQERAVNDAIVIRNDHREALEGELGEDAFATGLLIDIYEQTERLMEAAELDPGLTWKPADGLASYYQARQGRLNAVPYGPYGPTLNEAILTLRRHDLANKESSDQMLARLDKAQTPMLSLVLCLHPVFHPIKLLPRAIESYPFLGIGAA